MGGLKIASFTITKYRSYKSIEHISEVLKINDAVRMLSSTSSYHGYSKTGPDPPQTPNHSKGLRVFLLDPGLLFHKSSYNIDKTTLNIIQTLYKRSYLFTHVFVFRV